MHEKMIKYWNSKNHEVFHLISPALNYNWSSSNVNVKFGNVDHLWYIKKFLQPQHRKPHKFFVGFAENKDPTLQNVKCELYYFDDKHYTEEVVLRMINLKLFL